MKAINSSTSSIISNKEELESIQSYMSVINKEKQLSTEEELALAYLIKNGDQNALDKLVKANLKYVVTVAKQYQNMGLSIQDLISEGNYGLVRAAHKYDGSKNIKFITYATWWIQKAIVDAIASQAETIRKSGSMNGVINSVKKFMEDFEQKNYRPATIDEIAEELGLTNEKVILAFESMKKNVSIDSPVTSDDDDNDVSVGNFINNPSSDLADKAVEEENMKAELDKVLNSVLSEREIKIIKNKGK